MIFFQFVREGGIGIRAGVHRIVTASVIVLMRQCAITVQEVVPEVDVRLDGEELAANPHVRTKPTNDFNMQFKSS